MIANCFFNEDCMAGLDRIPDGSVDLVVMDPPYECEHLGGSMFGSIKKYTQEIAPLTDGISNEVLDKIVTKMKRINLYVWCNKVQVLQYLNYFSKLDCNSDILTWHKTNPIPRCNGTYLPDTEYLLFFRDKGVPLYGTYESKRKWWVTPLNIADKALWAHPTIKPLSITRTIIQNSLPAGGGGDYLILDPFAGSGTTLVAAKELGYNYVGFEINSEYYEAAVARLRGVSTANKLEAYL